MPGAKIGFIKNAMICKGVRGRVIILRLIIQLRNNFLFVVSYMQNSILSSVATHRATNSLEPNMTLRFSMVFGYALWSHDVSRVCAPLPSVFVWVQCGSPSLFLLLLEHGFPVGVRGWARPSATAGANPDSLDQS